jgi:dTMP kinase
MKTKGFLICFTGIDGSGKTTLSKELVDLLNKKGVKCKYVHARLNPVILKPFILIGDWLFLRGSDISRDYSDYSKTKRKAIEKYSFLSSVYQKILLFDYIIQIFFKVKLPLIFGKNVICDRYVYDTVVTDLAVDMNYPRDRAMNMLNNLLRFFPEPDITFLVDVSEEIAYQRKDDTPALEYLKERRKVYSDIGKVYEMVILDGSKSLDELKHTIKMRVFEEMRDK